LVFAMVVSAARECRGSNQSLRMSLGGGLYERLQYRFEWWIFGWGPVVQVVILEPGYRSGSRSLVLNGFASDIVR